jgi:hypothetical protein
VASILQRVLKKADLHPRRKRGIADTWARAVGEELAAQTHPSRLSRGELVVDVGNSALLHELEGFRKQELLDQVLATDDSGRIRGLRFRLGVF